jgi:hypothetical protein
MERAEQWLRDTWAGTNRKVEIRYARRLPVSRTGVTCAASSTTRRQPVRLRQGDSWGVLNLTLKPTSYDRSFLPATGNFSDTGSGTCH